LEIYNKMFEKLLEEQIKQNPEKAEELDITEIIKNVTPEAAENLKKTLSVSAQEMLNERRKLSSEFIERNCDRWSQGFDLLESHIVISTEAGEEFNKAYRNEAARTNDLVFDLVVRHHARACHISREILYLLKGGYADAAHARWRALHEVTATAMFISKHGQECAERFYFHDIVDSYDAMTEHKKFEDRLNEKAATDEEIDRCKTEYDSIIHKYGDKFKDHYGWADKFIQGNNRIGFRAIEKDVELDHMRPYYKWASLNIHAGSKGMRQRLGLCEAKDDILLVGQSNSGMIDPAHATAISLYQITSTLLVLKPTLDHIIILEVLNQYTDEIGETFVKLSEEHKK